MVWDWRVAVDFLIVFLLARILIGWVVNNRALIRMAVVVLAASGIATLIRVLDLPLSQILVFTVLTPVAALILIAYAPELRRALDQSGLQSLFGRREARSRNLISCLADSLFEMSRLRRGCILALPHADNLLPYVVGGEEYDARISKSLLLSLFHPGCPRHDGAAIIRGWRLLRVGAVLPLSQNQPIREEWGTRHLAALGLTERCDADVLVVSEERGSISLVRRGKVFDLPIRSVEALEERMAELLQDTETASGSQQHWVGPAICWGVAAAIALVSLPVSGLILRQQLPPDAGTPAALPTSQMSVQVPILFKELPNGLYLEETDYSTCAVQLRFPAYGVSQAPDDLSISVSLATFESGVHQIPLTIRMMDNLPEGWEVVRYDPPEIEVSLANAQFGNFPVEVLLGAPPEGWRVADVKVSPAHIRVEVRDDRSLEDRRLTTEKVSIQNLDSQGPHTFEVLIDFSPTVYPVTRRTNDPVQVEVTLEPLEAPEAIPTENGEAAR